MATPERSARTPEAIPPWDLPGITTALSARAELCHDEHGISGLSLRVGQPPIADLELFPTTRSARFTTDVLTLTLHSLESPAASGTGVIFEARDHVLAVTPNGAATLVFRPRPEGTVSPQTAHMGLEGGERPPRLPAPLLEDFSASQTLSAEAETTETPQERVQVFGRLATNVRFKSHATGRLVGEFVLAERLEEEQTAFHKVAAFDNPKTKRRLASKLKELVEAGEIGKGQPVTVVGYRHLHERRKRDGTTTVIEEIYAVSISAR